MTKLKHPALLLCALAVIAAPPLAHDIHAQSQPSSSGGSLNDYQLPPGANSNRPAQPSIVGPVDPDVPASRPSRPSRPANPNANSETGANSSSATTSGSTPTTARPDSASRPSASQSGSGSSGQASNSAGQLANARSSAGASAGSATGGPNQGGAANDGAASEFSTQELQARDAGDSADGEARGSIAVTTDGTLPETDAEASDGPWSQGIVWLIWIAVAALAILALYSVWRVIRLRRSALELNQALELAPASGTSGLPADGPSAASDAGGAKDGAVKDGPSSEGAGEGAGDNDRDDEPEQDAAAAHAKTSAAAVAGGGAARTTSAHATPAQTKPAKTSAAKSAVRSGAAPAPLLPAKPAQLKVVQAELIRSVMNLRLRYIVELVNTSPNAISELIVEGDMVSAYSKPTNAANNGHVTVPLGRSGLPEQSEPMKLAATTDTLPHKHDISAVAPGETVRLVGEHNLPIQSIRPIMQGKVPLFVPLLRWRMEAANMPSSVRNFVLGRMGAQRNTKLRPIRLDEPPQSYPDLGLKPLD